MKQILILLALMVFISCNEKENWTDDGVLYEAQCIAVPDYYRKILGYDSIQYIERLRSFKGKHYKEANFCYPNEWQFEKFKKDTVFIHDTIYFYKQPKISSDGKIILDSQYIIYNKHAK